MYTTSCRSGSANRKIVNGPPMAECGPAVNGRICRVTAGCSVILIRCCSCRRATSRPPPGRRRAPPADARPQWGGVGAAEDLRAADPQLSPAVDLVVADRLAQADQRPRVFLG